MLASCSQTLQRVGLASVLMLTDSRSFRLVAGGAGGDWCVCGGGVDESVCVSVGLMPRDVTLK